MRRMNFMMMKYEDLAVKPIHTENKEGNDRLRTLHFQINEVLYFYSKKYADPTSTQELIDKLTNLGQIIKGLPNSHSKKQNEILDKMREIVKSLIKYKKEFNWSTDDKEKIENTINYTLYTYLTDKKNNNNVVSFEQNVKYLKETNRIISNMIKPFLKIYTGCTQTISLNKIKELNNEVYKNLGVYTHDFKDITQTYKEYIVTKNSI